jgi:hypothetical protein
MEEVADTIIRMVGTVIITTIMEALAAEETK